MVAALSLKGLFKVLRRIIIIHLSWSHVQRSPVHVFKSLDSTGRVGSSGPEVDMFEAPRLGHHMSSSSSSSWEELAC